MGYYFNFKNGQDKPLLFHVEEYKNTSDLFVAQEVGQAVPEEIRTEEHRMT